MSEGRYPQPTIYKPIKNKDYDYNRLHFRDHAHGDNIAGR